MNKKTMILVIALFPSVSYASFPTISELCTAGSELFCCRKSTTGAELVNCFTVSELRTADGRTLVRSELGTADGKVCLDIPARTVSDEEKEIALARYENVLRVFHDGKGNLPANIKSSLINKETIEIALAYKAEKAKSTQRPFKNELK